VKIGETGRGISIVGGCELYLGSASSLQVTGLLRHFFCKSMLEYQNFSIFLICYLTFLGIILAKFLENLSVFLTLNS